MEFRFLINAGYSFKDLLLLNKVVVRRKLFMRIFVPILRIALTLFGAFLLLSGLMLLFGDYDEKLTGVAAAVVGAVWLLLGLFYYRYLAWRSRRMSLKKLGDLMIILTETEVLEESQYTSSRFGYDVISELLLYRDTIFAFVDKRHALILPLRHLAQGTGEELTAFLEEHSGKSVKKL